jgi:hypothetical protein
MNQQTFRRWITPLAALFCGLAVFVLAAINGHAFEVIWLPAVLLAASWPSDSKRMLRDCLQRRRRS